MKEKRITHEHNPPNQRVVCQKAQKNQKKNKQNTKLIDVCSCVAAAG